MGETEVLPELRQIIGGMLYAANGSLSVDRIRSVFRSTAESEGGVTSDFGAVSASQVQEAIETLNRDLEQCRAGFRIVEVAGGYRIENDKACGPWLRHLLDRGRPNRLSVPALETLAVVAYRQPCTRAQIEEVRGVAVDQILRRLLELQLVRIVGRSDLPGRPWLFGTTPRFLEHFGLRNLDDLPSRDDLKRFDQPESGDAEPESESSEDPELFDKESAEAGDAS
jgi:segregation and condensation protein B